MRRKSAISRPIQPVRCSRRRQHASAGLVGPLLLEGQKVLLQHLVQGGLLRPPPEMGRALGMRPNASRYLHSRRLSANDRPRLRARAGRTRSLSSQHCRERGLHLLGGHARQGSGEKRVVGSARPI
jgi:hypothetical protein